MPSEANLVDYTYTHKNIETWALYALMSALSRVHPGQRPYLGLDWVLHPGQMPYLGLDVVLHPGQRPYLVM